MENDIKSHLNLEVEVLPIHCKRTVLHQHLHHLTGAQEVSNKTALLLTRAHRV